VLGRYEPIDNLVFIDQDVVDDESSAFLRPALPNVLQLLPHRVTDTVATHDEIVAECLDEIYVITPISPRTVDVFEITDEIGWASSTDLTTEMLLDNERRPLLTFDTPAKETIRGIGSLQNCSKMMDFQ
jgi:hypothetical protein